MKTLVSTLALILATTTLVEAQDARPAAALPYQNNFEKAEAGKVPDEFLVLDGGFVVKEEGGGRFLELPGSPLDTFGVLFGPTGRSDWSASARFHGTGQGRRFPTFAVGLNGVGGYKLRVSPGKKTLEIVKGDEIKAGVPFTWESGSWTLLRLQVRKMKDGEWKIEGRAWKQGAPEPSTWMISVDETTEPPAGRPSVWGSPYAGTPIRFDDLRVEAVVAK